MIQCILINRSLLVRSFGTVAIKAKISPSPTNTKVKKIAPAVTAVTNSATTSSSPPVAAAAAAAATTNNISNRGFHGGEKMKKSIISMRNELNGTN